MLILNVIKFKFCFLFTLLLTLSIFRLTTSVILTSRPTAVELAEGIDDVISHAFVQTGSELYYLSNDDDFSISLDEKKETTTSNLILDPEELDFGECYMGVPKVLTVKIYNPTDKTIHFKGISGNFAHFHSSFTTKKDLAPNEETTFDVIFLSRTERWVEDFIIIHLETGYLKLPVKGQGKKTPYRLKKQIVATVPMNSSFISPITIYNPHPKLLRITEIISSHNDVHLELPDSKTIKEISVDSWEIEPFTTKTLINAKILGAHEQNLLSYITLKTKLIDKDRKKFIKSKFSDTFENSVADNIIIPVDVKVEQKISIYSTTDLIDFGLIKAGMNSKDVKNIELFSTLSKSIDVQSVTFEGNNDFHNININFDPKNKVAISPSMDNKPGAPVKICKVQMITLPYINYLKRVHDLPAIAEVYMKGKIIVTFKHASFNVTIPYIATVYSGDLYHNSEGVSFHTSNKISTSKVVFFQNYLPFGVSIHNVKIIDKSKHDFQVNLIKKFVQIAPGDTTPAVRIKYLKKQENGYETSMKIYTNISNYEVPIKIYNGELEIIINSIDKTQFDFGTLSPSDERAIHFTIQNYGTVPIAIEKFYNPLEPFMKIVYKGQKDVPTGNDILSDEKSPPTYSKGDDEIIIKGKSISYFKLVLNLTDYSPLFNFHKKSSNIFSIITKFNIYQYKILFNISPGGLIHIPPYKELNFGEIFPGQVISKRLYLFSYFPQKMNLLRLSTLNNQGILFFESNTTITNNDNNKNKNDLIIQSGKINDLNRVILIPHLSCNEHCYIGIQLHSSDGQWFTYGMKLPQNLAEIDYYLFKNMKNRYERLIGMKKNIIEDSIIIDTTHVKNYEIPIKGELIWPKLMTTSEVIFPLTAVGNYTIMNLTIQNPSLQPIIVQLLPLVIYPDAEAFLHSFKEFLPPMPQPIEINETLMFSLRDTELFTLRPDSPVPKLREDLESIVNTPIPRFTLSMLLQPGMKVRIRLGFLPTDHILRSSLLIIRNNLTIVESVVLMGRGAHINMEVDGKLARTKDPLLFDIQPFHLSDCHNPKRLNHKLSTTLTVKRSFMVKNTGEIPFTVVNMSINNYICENRGFRVLNCEPFTLKPNETHILDIAYTPDFLMSWNEAALQLYMHMNSTSWMFPIAAAIPKHMLSKCYSALPRPPFEGFMYYSCVSALIFCLICVIACAYLEGDRTISHAIRLQYMPPKKVFDFKDISTQTSTSTTIRNTNSNIEENNELSLWKKGINYIISIVLYVCSLFWHEKITATRLRSSMKEPSKDKKKAVSETFKLYQETTRSIQKTALDTFKMRNPGLLKKDIDLEEITTNIKFKINENNDKKNIIEDEKEEKNEETNSVKRFPEIGKENNIIEKVVQQSNLNTKNQKGKKKGKSNKSNIIQNNKLSIIEEVKNKYEKKDKKYNGKDVIDNKKESSIINCDLKEKDKNIKNTSNILNILKEKVEAEKKIVKEKKIDKKKSEEFDNSIEKESLKEQPIEEEIDDKDSVSFIQKWIDSTKDAEKESSPDSVKSSSKKEDIEEECSYIDDEDVVDDMDPEEMDPELLIKKYKELKTKYAKDSSKKTLPTEIDMEKVKQVQKEILTQQFNMPLDDVAQWDPDNPCPPYQFMDLNSLVSDIISPNGIYNAEYMNSFNINPAAFNPSLNDPWNIMSAFTPGQNFFPPEHQMDNIFTNIDTTIPSTGSSNYFQNTSFPSFDRNPQIIPTTSISQSSMINTSPPTTTTSNTTQQQNNFPISSTDEFRIWNPLTQENNETFDSWMKHTGIDKIIDDDEKKK